MDRQCASCLRAFDDPFESYLYNEAPYQSYRCENCERDFCSNCISPFGQCEECENDDGFDDLTDTEI